MVQLENMKGLCKYCVGDCMRLELPEFEGMYKCNSFEPKEKNWYENYLEDFRNKKL